MIAKALRLSIGGQVVEISYHSAEQAGQMILDWAAEQKRLREEFEDDEDSVRAAR